MACDYISFEETAFSRAEKGEKSGACSAYLADPLSSTRFLLPLSTFSEGMTSAPSEGFAKVGDEGPENAGPETGDASPPGKGDRVRKVRLRGESVRTGCIMNL